MSNEELRSWRGWVIVIAALAAIGFIAPHADQRAAGAMATSVIDLEFAGTRETAWTLLQLAAAHRDLLYASVYWDFLLIAVYGAGLFFALRDFSEVLRPGEPTLLDRMTPRFVIAAVVCDVLQDGGILWMLGRPAGSWPGLAMVAALTTVLTLANWTLVIVAAGHLLWLMWLDFDLPGLIDALPALPALWQKKRAQSWTGPNMLVAGRRAGPAHPGGGGDSEESG